MQPELLEASWASRQHKVQAEFTARGLLRVERGTIWDGPVTTRWTQAALLQRCFLGTALGSYTVKVTNAFPLPSPRQIFTKLTEKGKEVTLKMSQSSMVLFTYISFDEGSNYTKGRQRPHQCGRGSKNIPRRNS
jgi:hypothetical protein